MITLEMPWPPRELSPNARVHYMVRSRKAKQYRAACHLITRAECLTVGEGTLSMSLVFVPPTRRGRDDDNLIASFKAGRDGIAQALGIDDSRIRLENPQISDQTPPGGRVFVTLREVPA